MIDAESFMEFFEQNCGVKFMDAQTGQSALSVLRAKKRNKNLHAGGCLKCNWARKGDGVWLHEEDTVCVNPDSEKLADWVTSSDCCDFWQEKKATSTTGDGMGGSEKEAND
jgi:hypothetical protein